MTCHGHEGVEVALDLRHLSLPVWRGNPAAAQQSVLRLGRLRLAFRLAFWPLKLWLAKAWVA